jgi:putative sigma-54 modulation protein
MIYTEQIDGIKMNIQTVDLSISDEVQQKIREMIKRLQRHISEINWVDIHFKKESNHPTDNRAISVRLGIPGNDAFATGSGNHWINLLKKVEEKLRRQLGKRKKEN